MTTTYSHLDHRVIDINEMRPLLDRVIVAHWPEAALESAHISRVQPKRSGEIVIQFEIQYQGVDESLYGPRIMYAEHFPDGVEVDASNDPRAEWIEDFRLRIWPFPVDPQLDHLSLLCEPDRFHDTYDEDLSNVGYPGMSMGTPAHVLGYRLGRRCVARVAWQNRLEFPQPRFPKNDIVIKMSRKRQSLALWTRWKQLEHEGFCHNSSDGIGMPKSLFLHSDTGAIFQDFVHERSLHEMFGNDDFADHCERAGQTLRKLHASRIPGLTEYRLEHELANLRWLTAITGHCYPTVSTELEVKYLELERSTPTEDQDLFTTVHRDFYDKQVLSGRGRTFLLDCDTLAMADPALDFGNFAAHLYWRTLQHAEHARSITAGIGQFDRGYQNGQKGFHARAKWWTLAAILRLSCIYIWRPRWHSRGLALAQSEPGVATTLFA